MKKVLTLTTIALVLGIFTITGCNSEEAATPSDDKQETVANTSPANAEAIGNAEAGFEFMKTNCLACHSLPSKANFSNRDTDGIITLLAEHNGLAWPEENARDVSAWVYEDSER